MKIRFIALSGVAILLLSLSVEPASARTKLGATCKKLNSTITDAGQKFICLKAGRKLTWSKVATTIAIKEITSFEDAVNRPNDVSYWAWKKSSDQILSSSETVSGFELIVGPNTKLSNSNPKAALDAVKRLYPTFRHPKKTYAIYYGYDDIDWAQTRFSQIFSMSTGQEARNSCQKISECWGGSATITTEGDGVLLMAVMTSNPDRNHTSGTLEAHEYTHVVQVGSFFGTPQQRQAMFGIKALTPWWLSEGGAEFSQHAAIYAKSFAEYSVDRKFWANEFLENRNKRFTEQWIANYIKPPDTKVWSAPDTQWHIYDLGKLVTEIFTAIKGPAVNIQLFKDISDGMTFEQSFEKQFGVKWDTAVPLIAKSISQLVKK